MKEFTVKMCRRCQTVWYGDSNRLTLEKGDQLTLITVKIAFCTLCKQVHDQETNTPTYHRVPRRNK